MMNGMESSEFGASPVHGAGRDARQGLAMAAWAKRSSDPEESIALARRALEASGASAATIGRANVALATALLALRRPEEAGAAARAAIAVLEAEASAEQRQLAFEAHRCQMRSAFQLDDVPAAIRHVRVGLALAEGSGDNELLARAHSDSATVYGAIGLSERALEHLKACIGLVEDGDDAALASPLNNLGNVYLDLDRPDEALACFRRAQVVFRASANRLGATIARTNEARALVEIDRTDEAVGVLQDALAEFATIGEVDYVPPTHAKLAMAHARRSDHENAMREFGCAVEGHESGLGHAFEADTRRDYGAYLVDRGAFAAAQTQLRVALRLFEARSERVGKSEVLRLCSRAHEGMGDAPAALRDLQSYLKEYEALERERGDLRTQSQIVDLEVSLAMQHELSRLTTQALADANRTLRTQAQQLERLSSTDHLTGLYNRRYLAGRLADEVTRSDRHGFDLSLVMVDVDGFKAINDRYSHAVGDLVLARLAEVLRSSFRRSDVVARWGGEEFAILLPSTVKAEALGVAEKARRSVAEHPWDELVEGMRVTVSVGVVSLLEDADLDLASLLRLADLRLYLAKDGGRDRIVGEH